MSRHRRIGSARRLPAACAAIAALWLGTSAAAQVLQGPWIEQADRAIDKHRKVDLRVVVVDAAGNPVPNAPVRIEQRAHAFTFGLRLRIEALPEALDAPLSDRAPVWRTFNAVTVDEGVSWIELNAGDNDWRTQRVDTAIDWAEARGLAVRWGGVISSDRVMAPDWALSADTQGLAVAMDEHVEHVLRHYGRRVNELDLYLDTLDDAVVADRLGSGAVRRLFVQARAAQPDAVLGVRFNESFSGQRLHRTLERLREMRASGVRFDRIAVEARFDGMVVQRPVKQALDWLAEFNVPIVIARLRVAGPSMDAAAINMETVLRTMFAHPSVQGVYFASIESAGMTDDTAALLNPVGKPTPAGEVFDRLTHDTWWTSERHTADELGNVRSRVFAGRYELLALLPDGSLARTATYIAPGPGEHTVIVQPIAEPAQPTQASAPTGAGDE